MNLLWTLVWGGLAVLVVVAAVRLRRRLGPPADAAPRLDDDAIRRIEAEGRFLSQEDEPLDLNEIAEEERRFWDEEEWDSAEEL
ncbi:MAG: hypothetical protein KY453_05485 [Gemmatimonadetes bacterium]|nr:hypothetical protein [Gemmatimonadota bacterium]